MLVSDGVAIVIIISSDTINFSGVISRITALNNIVADREGDIVGTSNSFSSEVSVLLSIRSKIVDSIIINEEGSAGIDGQSAGGSKSQ